MADEIKATKTTVEKVIGSVNNFYVRYRAFKRAVSKVRSKISIIATDVKNLPYDLVDEGLLWGEKGAVALLTSAEEKYLTDGERAEISRLIANIYGKAQTVKTATTDAIVKATPTNSSSAPGQVASSSAATKSQAKSKAKKTFKVLGQGSGSNAGVILCPSALAGAKDEFNDKYGAGSVQW